MPRHMIEFNLPDEKYDLDIAFNAQNYFHALTDLAQYLKSETKYNTGNDQARSLLFDEIYKNFWEILNDNGIEL